MQKIELVSRKSFLDPSPEPVKSGAMKANVTREVEVIEKSGLS